VIKDKVVTIEEAAKLINTGNTIAVTGNGSIQLPDRVLESLEERFLATGEPRNLTVLLPSAPGALKGTGSDRFGHEGLIKRVISSCITAWEQRRIYDLIINNKIEAYCLPMGVLCRLLLSIAGREPGVLTSVGLHTFVDPRQGGGKYNSLTKEDLVEVININGHEFLLYKAYPIDVSVIRGTTADEDGNITVELEPSIEAIHAFAFAAKNSGGKVIAQVNRLAKGGSLDPRLVKVPGNLVDAIVVDKDQQPTHKGYDPSLIGEVQVPEHTIESIPLTHEKIIARRALIEIKPGDCVDLGIGIPVNVGIVGQEEDLCDKIMFCTEHGGFGGMPAEEAIFGATVNPRALIDIIDTFIFFNGGGLDVACLAFAQIDRNGNVNVTRHGKVIHSCGGFIDITHRAKKIIFCGSFTAGGPKIELRDSKLAILQEGRYKKFVNNVEEITAPGPPMIQKGQEVFYVTERAVFTLTSRGPCLIEIAPGVELERDILQQMEFMPAISENLGLMERKIFSEDPMDLFRNSTRNR
jgi:propionate CoA-transferase